MHGNNKKCKKTLSSSSTNLQSMLDVIKYGRDMTSIYGNKKTN